MQTENGTLRSFNKQQKLPTNIEWNTQIIQYTTETTHKQRMEHSDHLINNRNYPQT